jgi:hypothetical protein
VSTNDCQIIVEPLLFHTKSTILIQAQDTLAHFFPSLSLIGFILIC